ncbi:hypothetical protein BGW80DRAFT_1270840 [Lactifluus volemus]|nr:hypothetical protein BGW80DRAFT_1270840 [Lactifluus volemus]
MPSQRDLSWTPSRLTLIKTPFLLVRFVVFSVLIYLSLTALVFAAWNVGASRTAGAHVDGASALVIFTASAMILCIPMALADAKIAFFSTSMVGFECVWTGIFTVLQIAASIFVTLSGPPEFCVAMVQLSICSSITILVPVSWLATFLLLGYFVTIMALSVSHLHVRENLLSISIYNLVWFDDEAKNKSTSAPQLPPLNTPSARLSIVSRRHSTSSLPRTRRGDVENQLPSNFNRDKPLPSSPSSTWWGRLVPGRAGRDHPFTIRRARDGVDIPNLPRSTSDNLQQQTSIGAPPASRPYYHFNHQGADGWQQQQEQTQTQYVSSQLRFPPYPAPWPSQDESTLNEDEPIPVGDRSQWVQAAAAPGPYTPRLRGPRPW